MEDPNKLQRDVSLLLNEREMVVITARDIYCASIRAGNGSSVEAAVDVAEQIVTAVNQKYAERLSEAEEKFDTAVEELQNLKKKMMEGMSQQQQGKILRVPGCSGLECGH